MDPQTNFRSFCQSEELDTSTVDLLDKNGVDSKRKLRALNDADIKELSLNMGQNCVLREVVSKLKQEEACRDSTAREFHLDQSPVGESPSSSSELRLVLVGKTGSGKSSTGNTILRRKDFEETFGQASGTTFCQNQSVKIDSTHVMVVDTPGICDTYLKEADIQFEISRCLLLCAPGPHALLFVISAADRFTEEEEKAYYLLKAMFAKDIKNYLIVVFTHCEDLNSDKETLRKMLEKNGEKVDEARRERRNLPDIRKILDDAAGRFVIISNRADQETKDKQVRELLRVIKPGMGLKCNPYFQDDKTKRATEYKERLLSEIMGENPGMSREKASALLPQKLTQIKTKKALKMALVATIMIGGAAVTGGACSVM